MNLLKKYDAGSIRIKPSILLTVKDGTTPYSTGVTGKDKEGCSKNGEFSLQK